jgi:hypothetical protein
MTLVIEDITKVNQDITLVMEVIPQKKLLPLGHDKTGDSE